jgi:hypothetical protein
MKKFRILGRDIDLIELAIGEAMGLAVIGLAGWFITDALTSDWAKAVALVSVVALVILAPILFLYGPPWSSKSPQNPITLNIGGGAPQATEPVPPPLEKAPPEPEEKTKTPSVPELQARVELWRASAYRWEYAYLNYALVLRTQAVLDWLYQQREQAPIALAWYRTFFAGAPPKEQEAMLNVLEQHYLLTYVSDEAVKITPKGTEYVEWRGPDFVTNWFRRLVEQQQKKKAAQAEEKPIDQATSSA